MTTSSIEQFLNSEDPLSDEAIKFLAAYKEEDWLIDFKETFDPSSEHDWLQITKDIMAFANTLGGYLLFGVRDGTFDLVGVTPELARTLSDSHLIMQKVNRFVDPQITLLRSKRFEYEGKLLIALFVPRSLRTTHIVSRDGSFTYSSGKEKMLLQKGTFYVRRSAGVHLADSRDFDAIVNRRIEEFRESLFHKIARVVEAPPESEVFVISEDPSEEPHKRFIIDDAPDAIPVKGMSFSVAPKTLEQVIAAWIAMSSRDSHTLPPSHELWGWFDARQKLHLVPKQRLHVARFCLFKEVPVFYWLRDCPGPAIKEMLAGVMSARPPGMQLEYLLAVSAFLGKRFYGSMVGRLGDYAKRVPARMKKYPQGGPRSLVRLDAIERRKVREFKGNESDLRFALLSELNQIAARVIKYKKEEPNASERWEAQAIDCYLYAQDNQYREVLPISGQLELSGSKETAKDV